MVTKDYYLILGLSRNATQDEIKVAYKERILKLHPDKNNGDKFFSDMFTEVSEAFFLLSNEAKRKEYDKLIEPPKEVVTPSPQRMTSKSESHHYTAGDLSKDNINYQSHIWWAIGAIAIILICSYLFKKDSDNNRTSNSESTTSTYSSPTPSGQPVSNEAMSTTAPASNAQPTPDSQGKSQSDPIAQIHTIAKKGYDAMISKGINPAIAKQTTESWVNIQLGNNPNLELPIHRVGINEFQKVAQRAQDLYNEDVKSSTYPDKALQSAIVFIKNQAQFYNTDNTKVQSLDVQVQHR